MLNKKPHSSILEENSFEIYDILCIYISIMSFIFQIQLYLRVFAIYPFVHIQVYFSHSFIQRKQPLSNTDSLLNVCAIQKQHKHHFLSFFMLLCIIIMAICVAMLSFISSSYILLRRGIRRISKEVD